MPRFEIPAAVVLAPLLVLALAAVVWQLRRRSALTVPRLVVGVLACGYGAALLDEVLLPLSFRSDPSYVDQPWSVWIQLVPLITADPIGIVLNVALFVPLGILLPFAARVSSAARMLLVCFLVSLGIEVVQFVLALFGGGRIFDIDDLLADCAGGLGGYAVFRLVTRVPVVAWLAGIATWPAGPPAPRDEPVRAP